MKVLVFGAAGMLGQDVVKQLTARGHTAVPLCRAEADVTDPSAVDRAVAAQQPDLVVNCAAYTKVDQAEAERELAFAVNGAGAGHVAVAAAARQIPVIYVSTDYVFDGSKQGGYLESDPVCPLSVYGASKAEGEAQVRLANPRHAIVRTQWLFGAGGPNFVRTMLRLGRERGSVQLVSDQIGSPTYTPDLASAMVSIAEEGAQGTFHITNSGICSWKTFAERVFALAGLDVSVSSITTDQLKRPARRPLNGVLANSRWLADRDRLLRSYEEALVHYLQQLREEPT